MYNGRKLAIKVKNAVNLSKIFFSANNFFMHIFNMSVTYLQSNKRIHFKALGGVDFTKYALLPNSQCVQWSKIG